jgi:hypothetical protein
VRENPGLDATWISWLVVGCGAALLWSAVGIDRTRVAALRRRLLIAGGVIAVGLASLIVTGGSPDRSAGEARRVADAFTLARLTEGASATLPYLAPDAAPLEAQLRPGPSATAGAAGRLVATGVVLDCGQTPILQRGARSERCVAYDDGSRVFLWRDDGRWLVVGFTPG